MRVVMAPTAFVLAAAACVPALADGLKLKGPPEAAIINYNQKNDGGWTQSFEEARPALEEALGTKLVSVDRVTEDTARVQAIVEQLIGRGRNVIIGTAYGYSDAFAALARKHPTVAFLNANGTSNGPNLESFYGRTYESQFLCGMVAGGMSKTGKIGFVAPNPIGPVNWSVNAYALGARAVRPGATVNVVFTGSWNDPVKERQAAAALIDQGSDVIGQSVDTPTAQIVAQERGVYATGNWRDMTEFAPKANVCSQTWVWAKLLAPEIAQIRAGTWTPKPHGIFAGIGDGGTDIACCGAAVPEELKRRVMDARQAIIAGRHVFMGPLRDRNGVETVAAGRSPSDAELFKMNWFVDGVVSQQ